MTNFYDIVAPAAKLIITWMSRRTLPQVNGRINVEGLSEPVEVIRDKWGIPHIDAKNPPDLFFAQGFVHAQDRLWQMELNRRTAQGRLSEIFGEIALDTDRTARTFGFNRLAQQDWELFDDFSRSAIIAYTRGVNAFLDLNKSKLPVEFTLISHQLDPWHELDSVAFTRVMMWQLSHAWYNEIVRAQIIEATSPELAAELEIQYPVHNPVCLPAGIEFNLLDSENRLIKGSGPFINRGMGSNAWAVNGVKSFTGKPILCNDMHLQISLPGLWYQAHLATEIFQVTGVTLPGIPGVLVGHSDHIAWGMTLAFTDCEDLFIERFNPDSPNEYLTENGWEEAEIITENIEVKGKTKPHLEEVIITRHGPVVSDVIGYTQERVSVKSMALQPSLAFQGWMFLNQATNWDEFIDAMQFIDAPQLNVTYADTSGNIGYWITGKVPIRKNGKGQIPAPGWNGEYEWIGVVPFEHMPHSFNPESGYVLNCNNSIIPDDYPYYLGNEWMNGYRARRISDLLTGKEKFSPDDFRKIHIDFTCLPAMELVPHLHELTCEDPDLQKALEILINWDGKLDTESIGGTLYEVFRYTLVRNIFEPTLGEDLCNKVMGQGFHPLLLSSNEFFGHDTVTMLRLLDNPDSWWIRNAGGKQELLKKSFKQAVQWLKNELGSDLSTWHWGKIHKVNFSHALGLQKPLDKVFNCGPFPIGGDTDTPCQTAMLPNDPYDNNAWAPSFRQIVDLSDLSKSVGMVPPGQSGQLGSDHYSDLIESWIDGEYFPVLWTKEQIEKASKARLILE
jgi:penicillin amidase